MARPVRKQAWEILLDEDGIHTVTRGHRSVATGLNSLDRAKDVVRFARLAGERVTFVDPDGYRTDLTRGFKDPEPTQRTAQKDLPADPADPHPLRTRYLARYGRRPT